MEPRPKLDHDKLSLKHELKKKSLHCTLFIAVVGEDGDDGEATGKRIAIINY